MKQALRTILFAAGLGLFSALVLAGVELGTRKAREENMLAEKQRQVLSVLQIPVAEEASNAEVIKAFQAAVRTSRRNGLPFYEYVPAGASAPQRVAVEFTGNGLWGPIKGFLALTPDLKATAGFSIYQQEETPGLGADIARSPFKDQFDRGLAVADAAGRPGLDVIRPGGAAPAGNQVLGITGATLSCDRVEVILNDTLGRLLAEKKP